MFIIRDRKYIKGKKVLHRLKCCIDYNYIADVIQNQVFVNTTKEAELKSRFALLSLNIITVLRFRVYTLCASYKF